MSLGARAPKGAGGAKAAKEKGTDKGKTDKPQPKEKVKPQATTEQLRMANMIDRKSEDATDVRRMVLELMEMTRRTEEEVCSALHDCDNDMVGACNLLLEDTQRIQGEWQTNEKKKKKPSAAAGNGEAEPPPNDGRSRSGPRTRRGEGEGGSGRGRGARGGRGGGRGGRGGGGRGARRPQPLRRPRQEPNWDDPSDTVGGSGGVADSFPATEDWDNEEWSGSLEETKVLVFTPSANAQNAIPEPEPVANNTEEDWDNVESNGLPEAHITSYTYSSLRVQAQQHIQPKPQEQQRTVTNSLGGVGVTGVGGGTVSGSSGGGGVPSQTVPDNTYRPHQPMGMTGTLTAAQSQYLSQLTARSSDPAYSQPAQPTVQTAHTTHTGVPTGHTGVPTGHTGVPTGHTIPAAYSYGQPAPDTATRKPQRARVPPPSKIPSSAVEMPGGGSEGGGMFLDVQFGALEPDSLALNDTPAPAPAPAPAPEPQHQPAQHQPTQHQPAHHQPAPKQVSSAAETPVHDTQTDTSQPVANSYANNTNSMLNESLSGSVADTTPTSQPVTSESIVTNTNASLDKQLSAGMKQLSVSGAVSSGAAPSAGAGAGAEPQPMYTQHVRAKQQTVTAANVYAHHAVSHHPPVYGANVYAPQVNSTNASLSAAGMPAPYPSSVTLTQYQPIMNSYQQTSSSATVYGNSALYTAGNVGTQQYTYQPQPKLTQKDAHAHAHAAQYESAVASSNSLTSTSTTQTSSAKVATTTVSGATGASATGVTAGSGAGGYAATAALYGATGSATYAPYDDQMMRSTLPHHMGGYYEVGYGVSGGREGTFGLGAGERFGRADAASPQQVPPTALPPGYAYFYQPPPTTYQYGVYPTYGTGTNVGGVGNVGGVSGGGGKLSTYAPQQAPYDAQDTYKQAGGYTGSGKATGGGAAADLANTMYAKGHVALNKVNSYEKAAFHSGTPPPFSGASHLYIPAPPHHHHPHHAPQQHQMDARVSSSHNRRAESATSGARGGAGGAAGTKPPASKPNYTQNYWAPN